MEGPGQVSPSGFTPECDYSILKSTFELELLNVGYHFVEGLEIDDLDFFSYIIFYKRSLLGFFFFLLKIIYIYIITCIYSEKIISLIFLFLVSKMVYQCICFPSLSLFLLLLIMGKGQSTYFLYYQFISIAFLNLLPKNWTA